MNPTFLSLGEIIQLAPTTNLMFEPMDLEVASPATVSRCGMIYMEPSTLGWRPVVKSWLNEMPSSITEMYKSTVNDLFERFCDACIQLVRKGGVKEQAPTSDTQLIKVTVLFSNCLVQSEHASSWQIAQVTKYF